MTSLRARLLAFLLALGTVAAALIAVVTYRAVLAESDQLFDYQLRQMALSLRDQGRIAVPARRGLEHLDYVVQVWSADGTVVYSSHPAPLLPPRVLLGYSVVDAGGQRWRVFSLTTRGRVIQVGQPLAVRRSLAATAAWRSVLPIAVAAPIVALAAWWIVGFSLAPLAPVVGALKRRAAQSLEPLPAGDLPDEVAPLVSALNGLLGRLETAFAAQRAFVADAAHELRSPLTALKLQLDVLRGATSDAERAEAETALRAGVARAQRLVEQLLALARVEPGGAEAETAPLNLTEVARQATADMVPQAQAAGVTLALLDDTPLPARGDAAALRVLLRNLVDNAVRYAGRGARVELSLGRDGQDRAWVRVDDSGPGIPAGERERVFARFYRRDGQIEGGSGLGLSIVRAIAERHAATLALADAPLGGLRVTLTLP